MVEQTVSNFAAKLEAEISSHGDVSKTPAVDEQLVFDHVVNDLLRAKSDECPLRLCIQHNFVEMELIEFLNYKPEEFKAMRYPDPKHKGKGPPTHIQIATGYANLLINLQAFIY